MQRLLFNLILTYVFLNSFSTTLYSNPLKISDMYLDDRSPRQCVVSLLTLKTNSGKGHSAVVFEGYDEEIRNNIKHSKNNHKCSCFKRFLNWLSPGMFNETQEIEDDGYRAKGYHVVGNGTIKSWNTKECVDSINASKYLVSKSWVIKHEDFVRAQKVINSFDWKVDYSQWLYLFQNDEEDQSTFNCATFVQFILEKCLIKGSLIGHPYVLVRHPYNLADVAKKFIYNGDLSQ